MAFKPGERITAARLNEELSGMGDRNRPVAGPGILGGTFAGASVLEKGGHQIIPPRRATTAGFSIPSVATFGDLAALGLTHPAKAFVIDEDIYYNLHGDDTTWLPESIYLPWTGA